MQTLAQAIQEWIHRELLEAEDLLEAAEETQDGAEKAAFQDGVIQALTRLRDRFFTPNKEQPE